MADVTDWLPPAGARNDRQTAMLRTRSVRSAGFGLASAVVMLAGLVGIRYDSAGFWSVIGGIAAIYGLIGTLTGILTAVSWWRDYRVVRTTGWRPAAVLSATFENAHRRVAVSALVEFRDGSLIRVRADSLDPKASPLFRRQRPQVLVGGAGKRMVLLFDGKPRLVQMKAETYRWLPEA